MVVYLLGLAVLVDLPVFIVPQTVNVGVKDHLSFSEIVFYSSCLDRSLDETNKHNICHLKEWNHEVEY